MEHTANKQPLQICYMRDNHTFVPLSLDVESTIMQLLEEFQDGYTYGTLFCRGMNAGNYVDQCVHASGSQNVCTFLKKVQAVLSRLKQAEPA
jgi:hypothetical protein